jgi:hypothetical protein
MDNPNPTAMYLPRPYPSALTPEWKKFIIQAATPNDTRLDFSQKQKALIPRIYSNVYGVPSYPKPNTTTSTGTLDENTDIAFMQCVTPNFPIWVEKIKVCLHQPATYGCVKLNVWDFGDSEENVPVNLVGINEGQSSNENIPLTLNPSTELVSNVLADPDLYMVESEQLSIYDPFGYTIDENSILRFGIQYAEGDAYGLKVFLIGWVMECEGSGEGGWESDLLTEYSYEDNVDGTGGGEDGIGSDINNAVINVVSPDSGHWRLNGQITAGTYVHLVEESSIGGTSTTISFDIGSETTYSFTGTYEAGTEKKDQFIFKLNDTILYDTGLVDGGGAISF